MNELTNTLLEKGHSVNIITDTMNGLLEQNIITLQSEEALKIIHDMANTDNENNERINELVAEINKESTISQTIEINKEQEYQKKIKASNEHSRAHHENAIEQYERSITLSSYDISPQHNERQLGNIER
ncbi:hypothetical protein [Aliivibrio fischeri]|uniref:Uncharacterized protein n=1 Tax=Aliivibrio fischeri TaxID=668 RepID=A0A510URP3_ALIFS|nr:hypothetical protein [Aliivibrio fischeri]GEK15900.1 hypothetical protein AFI02nite_39360 [Aliivibrio fischeri]